MNLALFDLDGTLLSGDSDLLWCGFLVDHGLLDDEFRRRGEVLTSRYIAGTVMQMDFCGFYAEIQAGYRLSDLQALRERFLREVVLPLIPEDARALLRRHREAGDTVVLTTATNRVVSELTAAELRVDHYICTELEQVDGRLTGRTVGLPNMREGKVQRLRQWLTHSGQPEHLLRDACFYSDSINDLALLSAVRHPVVVNPDPRLESAALRNRWKMLRLNRAG